MAKDKKNYHFRELPSWCFEQHKLPAEFLQFVKHSILPHVQLTGYKLDQQRLLVAHLIHNLTLTGLVGACVSDTRDATKPEAKRRAKLWDAVIAAGFARQCRGSESSGRVTRYRATSKLLAIRDEWRLRLMLDLVLVRNTELGDAPQPLALVYLHTGRIDVTTGDLMPDEQQKQPIPFPKDPGALEYFREIEDIIEAINRSNLAHSWQAFRKHQETSREYVFQPNPCIRQIHVGQFFRAVRLYSWSALSGQNLSKRLRQTMLIDGEPVAELDFSGMVTRMLYHFARLDPRGDVYRPQRIMPRLYSFRNLSAIKKEIARDFVKRCTNICWNVSSQSKAHSSIGKLLAEHEHQKFLKQAVYQIEHSGPADIVQRIQAAHPDLAHRFFTECGLEMMTVDGKIMLHILHAFAKAGRPALGIHDAVVCRVSDVSFTRQTMSDVYQSFLQFAPVIKRVY